MPDQQPPFTPLTLLDGMNQRRPRLLINGQAGLEGLCRKIKQHSHLDAWAGHLRRRADILVDKPVVVADPLKTTSHSRMLMERTLTLSLMYQIDRNAAYLQKTCLELESAALEMSWVSQHKRDFALETSEATTACALGLDWLHDHLAPAIRATVVKAIIEKGLQPALREYAKPAGIRYWPDRNNNWNQVCNGGVILGALAVAEDCPEIAAQSINEALKSLPTSMSELNPDGGHEEGPMYWGYGTLWNVMALAAMETALGRPQPLTDAFPGFALTGEYRLHAYGPTGQAFNYSDCSETQNPAPQLFWLARRFNRPDYNWNELERIRRQESLAISTNTTHEHALEKTPVHPLDLVWHDPETKPVEPAELPLDRRFVRHEVLFMRSSWNNPNALYLGFKGGSGRGVSGHCCHTQLDAGSFVFDAIGERWAIDPGSDSYGLPGYFETWAGSLMRRFSYYRMRAEGHNTLVINPHLQPQQDPSAIARIISQGSTPEKAWAICDLSPVYANQAASVKRGVALLDYRSRLLVQDEIRAADPVNLWWFMHTRAEVEIGPEGKSAILNLNGKQLEVHMLGETEAQFTVMPAQPMIHSPAPEGQHPNPDFRKLAINLGPAVNPSLAILMTPRPASGEPHHDADPKITALQFWA